MSEEKKMIYCTQCGSGNEASSKFCSNCGSKLEQQTEAAAEEKSVQSEGIFSGEETKPIYEKITDAEEEKPAPIPYQEEIKINYGSEQSFRNDSFNTNTGSSYYNTQSAQYYSGGQDAEKQGGGNIGFAIASLVCGILSLVCCCLTYFGAVLAIAAIVLGIITLCFKYDGKGMAIAGIATGGIGLVIIIMLMVVANSSAYSDLLYEISNELY